MKHTKKIDGCYIRRWIIERTDKEIMKRKITFVFGGTRSGKSSYAYRLADKTFKKPVYLATAEAFDKEMKERIALHQKQRGAKWQCVESPIDLAGVLLDPKLKCDGILVDCLTVWLSNVLLQKGEKALAPAIKELVAAVKKAKRPLVIVSNEVGMGIVPESKLGRIFRDYAGWLNQDMAEIADEVVFVVSGVPMVLKRGMSRRAIGSK